MPRVVPRTGLKRSGLTLLFIIICIFGGSKIIVACSACAHKEACTPGGKEMLHNSRDMKATQMSINRWMDRENVVCDYNEILLSHKRNGAGVSWSEVDEPRVCYTEWSQKQENKHDTLTHIYCCSLTQLCLTLCDPVDCSTPGFPVLHHLPELAQTCVHWVGDAIQPSCPLSSPSPPAFRRRASRRSYSNTNVWVRVSQRNRSNRSHIDRWERKEGWGNLL